MLSGQSMAKAGLLTCESGQEFTLQKLEDEVMRFPNG